MAGSFRKIDYRLRPAKHVERLMLCDAFRRLRFYPIERYHYIGMGSVYFSDFSLFHRALGISAMTSIEGSSSPSVQKRFEDNRPFSKIDILWGRSGAVLPSISLDGPTILWMDYDGRLDLNVLGDISAIASRVSSGSTLVVSVQCLPAQGEGVDGFDYDASEPSPLLTYASHVFGLDRIDPSWKESDFVGWGTAKIFWALLTNELNSAIAARNGGALPEGRVEAKQIVHFHYSDGAYMLTVGWVFVSPQHAGTFEQCAFEQLGFYREGQEPFKIALPLLTLRELRQLEKQLPEGISNPELGSIPGGDAKKFIALYRYFPDFAPTAL